MRYKTQKSYYKNSIFLLYERIKTKKLVIIFLLSTDNRLCSFGRRRLGTGAGAGGGDVTILTF